MSKTKTNHRGGFTLIELLIVIAIIGILAGVILVSTSGARNKANDNGALQSVKSAATAAGSCLIGGGILTYRYGTPVVGAAICNPADSATWPKLSGNWSINYVDYDIANGYYWIRAIDGAKIIICNFWSAGGGTDGIWGNNTYKCDKIGF